MLIDVIILGLKLGTRKSIEEPNQLTADSTEATGLTDLPGSPVKHRAEPEANNMSEVCTLIVVGRIFF